MIRTLLAVGAVVTLSACGWMSDDEGLVVNTSDDYVEAKEGRMLVVPEDLDRSRIRDAWPVPPIEDLPLAKVYPKAAPRPDAIFGDEGDDQVKIQRLRDRRWLVVGDTPSEVWPVVKQFLADSGVAVASEDLRTGVIESEWMDVDVRSRDVVRLTIQMGKEKEEVAGGRDRVKFKVEQGIRHGSSEIHVRHENDGLADPVTWPEFSMMNLLESDLLSELGAYYAAGVAGQSVSRVGQQVSTEAKALIERDAEGYPRLRLNIDFERAWATVGQALERAEIEVVTLKREEGVFQVNIDSDLLTGEDGPSWFRRMLPGDATPALDVEIRIRPLGDAQVVAVYGVDGDLLPIETGQQILVMLREFAA